MGSFLHCMGWRVVHNENFLKGRSHCDHCGHALGMRDLFPVFSYLFSKGRCRYCGEKISPANLWAEIISAIVYVTILLRFGLTPELIEYWLFASVLIVCSVTDLYEFLIPDRFLLFGAAVWLVFTLLSGDIVHGLIQGALGGLAVGGGLLLVVLLYEKLRNKEAMGGGDIKLLAVTGLYLGWKGNLLCLLFGCILGIVMGMILLRRNRDSAEDDEESKQFPWGPSIAAAAWLVLLAGDGLIEAYLGMF